ncbi:methyltransferase domain-containing protein [Thermomonospora umbrina]|uniref:Protein-L-isoaspartate O-methyltransferase n=1 Tax=Thermomonospora umbrina TaxID=111806 RepID=A0A3D9SL93_9ACTN|nr:methyltransferase domain-containing protein [Thermomonospora umbrina]REE96487.1 protein-L-isoaspartate(D-aspartate) O-methyltransferase [Thermomonospora umbrina]
MERWAEAFQDLPRAAFLPDVLWPKDPETGRRVRVDRVEDPEGWRAWAERDVPIVVGWRDAPPGGREAGTEATSSASQPSLVVDMLADLDVRPGHRVLDAGTGTGWTTALLAARTGSANVVGVEYDPDVAEAARDRLRAAGLEPLVVTGDGGAGWEAGAPYDRIQGTYAVRRIPEAWVRQTRPGGVIVAPWRTRLGDQGAVARLTVAEDGTASGPFTRATTFMRSKAETDDDVDPDDYLPPGGEGWPDDTMESTTALRPEDLWSHPQGAAWFVVGLLLRDVTHLLGTDGDGAAVGWLYSLRCRSWAAVFSDGDVYEHGPRRLWREVERAHGRWIAEGRPDQRDFGLTIERGEERVWLREPGRAL